MECGCLRHLAAIVCCHSNGVPQWLATAMSPSSSCLVLTTDQPGGLSVTIHLSLHDTHIVTVLSPHNGPRDVCVTVISMSTVGEFKRQYAHCIPITRNTILPQSALTASHRPQWPQTSMAPDINGLV